MTKHRILWLINHTTLRKFEIPQLKALGLECFTPKSFIYDEGNLSASVDYSEDANLSIPKADLDILNAQNWYKSPSAEAWEIANKYFDIAVVAFFPEQLKSVVHNFKGSIVLRAFGLTTGCTYTNLIYQLAGEELVRDIKALGNRFWFGAGYEHLSEIESDFIADRNCFLPVGLAHSDTSKQWSGIDAKVLFVCPRISTSPYFNNIYKDFKKNFGDFLHTIGGAQPIKVDDPNVIGFVSREEHDRNMREHRVMFYHSQEPYHIHYHQFEAIAAGMPLLFMAGGMLDELGGKGLPGRCKTFSEAKKKARRILKGDKRLINKIRKTQTVLLDAVSAENCAPIWQKNFQKILDELENRKNFSNLPLKKKKKVAVILPLEYKGGTLRGSIMVAQAIRQGSIQAQEPVDVILVHLDDQTVYRDEDFTDLPSDIKRRAMCYTVLNSDEAFRAMYYAGYDDWKPGADKYLIFNDNVRQLQDCDLWFIVSDRLTLPVLPLRPTASLIFDYIQRYFPSILPSDLNNQFITTIRASNNVFVTTDFTYQDVVQYAGVNPDNVAKLPILSPSFDNQIFQKSSVKSDYFIWTTNSTIHKNHTNALAALQIYYQEMDGHMPCEITGVNTDKPLEELPEYFKKALKSFCSDKKLKKKINRRGNLSDDQYQQLLKNAAFLWHPCSIDNGTFSVVEAASLGVPSLSSDYPAMHEFNEQFELNLAWMDANNPQDMARALKTMEENHMARRQDLPGPEVFAKNSIDNLAKEYWKAVRQCL